MDHQPKGGGSSATNFSPTEVKEELGRGGAVRVQRDHQGNGMARTTEWGAGRNLTRGLPDTGPTQREMQIVFEENNSDYRIFKGTGMSDRNIYEILKDRN